MYRIAHRQADVICRRLEQHFVQAVVEAGVEQAASNERKQRVHGRGDDPGAPTCVGQPTEQRRLIARAQTIDTVQDDRTDLAGWRCERCAWRPSQDRSAEVWRKRTQHSLRRNLGTFQQDVMPRGHQGRERDAAETEIDMLLGFDQRGRPVSTGTSRNSESASAVANTCPVPRCFIWSVSVALSANSTSIRSSRGGRPSFTVNR